MFPVFQESEALSQPDCALLPPAMQSIPCAAELSVLGGGMGSFGGLWLWFQ